MPRTPIIQTVNITTTRTQLSKLVNQVFGREIRVIIEKSGIPVAGIVSAEDVARLEEFERQRTEDFGYFADIQKKFADVPLEQHEQEVARAVRQARSRLRATEHKSRASNTA